MAIWGNKISGEGSGCAKALGQERVYHVPAGQRELGGGLEMQLGEPDGADTGQRVRREFIQS